MSHTLYIVITIGYQLSGAHIGASSVHDIAAIFAGVIDGISDAMTMGRAATTIICAGFFCTIRDNDFVFFTTAPLLAATRDCEPLPAAQGAACIASASASSIADDLVTATAD